MCQCHPDWWLSHRESHTGSAGPRVEAARGAVGFTLRVSTDVSFRLWRGGGCIFILGDM